MVLSSEGFFSQKIGGGGGKWEGGEGGGGRHNHLDT